MKNLTSLLNNVPEIVGLEIYLLDERKMNIRYVKLKQRKNHVEFCKGEYHLKTLKDLKESLAAGPPLVISLNGRGVIHRTFEITNEVDVKNEIHTIWPGVSHESLYQQKTQTSSRLFVSLARKEIIVDLQIALEALGMEVFSISLGPFAVTSLLAHTEAPETGCFRLDGHQFSLNQSELIGYEAMKPLTTESRRTTLAGEELNECLVVAYATALCYLAKLPFPQILLTETLICREAYSHRRMFKLIAFGTASVFLLVLSLNAFLYYHYSSNLTYNQIDHIAKLNEEEEGLQKILKNKLAIDSMIIRPSTKQHIPLSGIADRIAASVPMSVTLSDMTVFPLDDELSRKKRRPAYDFECVRIQGSCESATELNHWIKSMRQLEFCERVDINTYSSINPEVPMFSIELLIK